MNLHTKTVEIAPPPPPDHIARLVGHLRSAAESAQCAAADLLEPIAVLLASAERRRYERRAA